MRFKSLLAIALLLPIAACTKAGSPICPRLPVPPPVLSQPIQELTQTGPIGAGTGAAIGAGTGYGAKKGAIIGGGAGAAAGAVYDILH